MESPRSAKSSQFNWNIDQIFQFTLWAIALHSLLIGIGLVYKPFQLMEFFGFHPCSERFFPTQGGVFHILMAIGYTYASIDLEKHQSLIHFAFIVKSVAAFYLFIYFFCVDYLIMVLFSGVVDGMMAIAIGLLNKRYWQIHFTRSIVHPLK